jgi:hypothetical protein
MKNFKYFYLLIYLLSLSFLAVFVGCGDDSNDPPPVINQPPDLSGLNDVTLSPGFETHEIDFANFVTDQEGDIITYDVTNSNDDVITISLSGTVLTITEVGPGTSDVTVTATDGNVGNEVTTTFTVTVEEVMGAPDFTGTAAVMIDFNGLTNGSVFDNPVPGFTIEGLTADGEYDGADIGPILIENDHWFITNNVEVTYMWSEYEIDGGNQDFTGKKFRFDYSFFTAPEFNNAHWEDDPPGIDVQVYFIDAEWGDVGGGKYRFSSLNLEFSNEWQSVEIPLADFTSLWELPVDASAVGWIGIEVWGGTPGAPISFRIDNFGIVD